MRPVPPDISNKLMSRRQTKANKADPSANIWIGRPTTPLTTDAFLERQTVRSGPVTDVSIAVCHPRLGASNTKVHLAYISNGVVKIVQSNHHTKLGNYIWTDVPFYSGGNGGPVYASAVSIAYNGTMPKTTRGIVEFVTETEPWVFWANGGKLYCRKLGLNADTTIILAEQNCTDVSAIRAMWSEIGAFDFGLIAFFLLNGKLYYRQYINDVWMDAELVTFGPSGTTWSEIAAFRTWDYRVGVQAKATNGKIYEIFTQFMGIGKQTTEHVAITDVAASGKRIAITYSDFRADENIGISNVQITTPYKGLYALNTPNIIAAYNIENIEGDWGRLAAFVFDAHLKALDVQNQAMAFRILGTNGVYYVATSSILAEDGKTVLLTFSNFNGAGDTAQAIYTPGTIKSMADITLVQTSFIFEPINLVPPQVDPPKVVGVINV